VTSDWVAPVAGSAARVIGVAVAIPPPHGPWLQAVRSRLGDPQAESIPTHVTLLPPTTVDASLLPEIDEHLTTVARAQSPFTMTLQGSGTFRPVSPVVFVTLVEGISACERLENAVRSGVLWRPLHFNYHPHVTVAHDLPDEVLDQAREELAEYSAEFLVDHFTVYEHVDGEWNPRRDFAFAAEPRD
jgi:2'-5' RNA ligase